LCATKTRPARRSCRPPASSPKLGAAATISSVMPVSAWIGLGMRPPGLTSVDHSALTSKPSTSSTAISVTRSDAGSVPVVSRSTMASGASARRTVLLGFDVGGLDHFAPARGVAADPLDELGRRIADRLGAQGLEALAHVRRREAGEHLALQP